MNGVDEVAVKLVKVSKPAAGLCDGYFFGV
jgi:hypothetical protein